MDTARAGRADAVIDGSAALPLVRAAAALRWSRPDLTATLAELALESAPDAVTWVTAAGWLLHGRVALGDGRDTALALLDGLARWGDAGAALMGGPEGRRLRVELAGPARRIGETAVARALLASTAGADDADPELRADVLTELARCAVDDAPETVDDALAAADEAWRATASMPGVASVTLLRAARSRRAGRADVAATEAVDGLTTLYVRGRRAGVTSSDHVAAALTAEWIAALVEAGRVDEARKDGVAAANRLVATARASRQVAGLRLAIARVTAVEDSPDAVLAALEPAAQVAADSDVPELESACRSMLGELHEAGGRLDAALAALRAAMTADRRDRERAAQLRARLTLVTGTWADRPSTGPVDGSGDTADRWSVRPSADPVAASGETVDRWGAGPNSGLVDASGEIGGWRTDPGSAGSVGRERLAGAPDDVDGPAVPAAGAGRRARRLAAEALEHRTGEGSAALDRDLSDANRRVGRDAARSAADGRGAVRAAGDSHGVGVVRAANGGGAARAADGRVADTGGGAPTGRTRHGAEPGTVPGLAVTPAGDPTSVRGTGSAASAVRAAYRAPGGGGSLIGDALLRELAEGGRPAADGAPRPPDRGTSGPGGPIDRDRPGAGTGAHDALFGPLRADASGGSNGRRSSRAGSSGPEPAPSSGDGSAGGHGTDSQPARRDPPAGRPAQTDDTVVFGMRLNDQGDLSVRQPRADGGDRELHDTWDASRPTRNGARSDVNGTAGHGTAEHGTGVRRAAGDGSGGRDAEGNGTGRRGADGNGSGGRRVGGNGTGDPPDGPPPGAHAPESPGGENRAAADDPTASSGTSGHTADGSRNGTADGTRAARRSASERGPGRPPSTDTDGLGLADLLAGALAAYRDL